MAQPGHLQTNRNHRKVQGVFFKVQVNKFEPLQLGVIKLAQSRALKWTMTFITILWQWLQFICQFLTVPRAQSQGLNLITYTSENTFLTFLWFPFICKCPGCTILTEEPFWKPIFPTHQCNGHFSPFLCWAPQAYWLHSKYTIFYWNTCSIEWVITEFFFECKIVEFLTKRQFCKPFCKQQ